MTTDATLVDLFAASVLKHAERPAVTDDERSLDYRTLDERSDATAALLVAHGAVPGDRVAIYLDRGTDVFVAMLAVLKARGAYVAVDPRYPDHRRDLLIAASGAKIVLTGHGWSGRLAGHITTVREWTAQDAPAGSPPPAPTAADAACVLFTSGSSGTPKAIVLEHRNLVYLATNSTLPSLGPSDRFGQVSSLSFDAFHVETWCSLAQGAEVVVLPAVPDLAMLDMRRELRRRRITAMLAPTMAVNHLVHEDREAFSALRVLYTGGDVIRPAAVRALLAGGFAGTFYNLYGPSEAATACTAFRVEEMADDCDNVPIGAAMSGASVQVLGADLRPMPAGEVGQLFIGGVGVGRGYLDAPALTAERFLPDPAGAAGARMYATGDLASAEPDGTIHFGGRIDEQVKIRGYRVEPAEAERTLVRHPDVRDAAVFVAGNGPDRRLVAAVVAEPAITPAVLREYLDAELPDYLVPALIVMAGSIPSTSHGKRDLVSLRETAQEHLDRNRRRVPAADDLERYLFAMWQELLGLEWIAEGDDFFALGGNSMLAFRAHLRVQRDLGVALDVATIFDNPLLADITHRVRVLELCVEAPVAGPASLAGTAR